MRDINRIEPFLEILLKFWKQHPNLRFGQIVQIFKENCKTDLFYLEDDKILEIIEDLIKGEGYMDTKSVIFDKLISLPSEDKQELITIELKEMDLDTINDIEDQMQIYIESLEKLEVKDGSVTIILKDKVEKTNEIIKFIMSSYRYRIALIERTKKENGR